MQFSNWETLNDDRSFLSHDSIFFSVTDFKTDFADSDDIFAEFLLGRSHLRISGKWCGTKKDCLNGVRLRTVSEFGGLPPTWQNLTRMIWLYLPTKLFWINFQAKILNSCRGSSRSGSVSSDRLSSWDLDVLKVLNYYKYLPFDCYQCIHPFVLKLLKLA